MEDRTTGSRCTAFTLISMLASSFVSKAVNELNTKSLITDLFTEKSYDFIIVGAGSAGSVLASRLSENDNWKVLLEAGCNEALFERVPTLFMTYVDRGCLWSYETLPHARVNGELPMTITTRKSLGGTTSLYDMTYVRGNKRDYDDWAARGNSGWDYQSVLPFFKKSENMKDPELARSEYHSTGGPHDVTLLNHRQDNVTEGVMKAFEELGLPPVDYNGEHQVGSSFTQLAMESGRKVTAKSASLDPVNRKNLVVRTYARVTRIIRDDVTKRAIGAEFINKLGMKKSAFASKEIVLSAGAIRTPQLLMVSGIGPREHLKSVSIP